MNTVLALSLFLALAAMASAQSPDAPKNVVQLFGKRALSIVRRPDEVSAVLLEDDHRGAPKEQGRPIRLTEKDQARVVELLSAHASYSWDLWKPCIPLYGARITLKRGTESVTVDFCFHCQILHVNPSGRSDEDTASFDASKDAWLRLFRSWFPKDKTLKKLH